MRIIFATCYNYYTLQRYEKGATNTNINCKNKSIMKKDEKRMSIRLVKCLVSVRRNASPKVSLGEALKNSIKESGCAGLLPQEADLLSNLKVIEGQRIKL